MIREVFTVIPKLPGSLLSHAGESDQCFQLLDYHLLMNQELVVDSYEAGMPSEHVSVSLLRVW